jgi:hypothetical protein
MSLKRNLRIRHYTQYVDLALNPKHIFFAFVDDHTNPKWQIT